MTVDPHRALKLKRLKEARDRISEFRSRKPSESDSEFNDWRRSVADLLQALVGSGYVMRLHSVRFSAVTHNYIRGSRVSGDPIKTWQSALKQADTILEEAIEEAELGPEASPSAETVSASPPSVTINLNNVFSPTVHVTFAQIVTQLEELRLPKAAHEKALEHLKELESQTTEGESWPVIAKSLEAMKAIGKGVYEKVALPLLVEFLKRQMLAP